MPRNKLSEKQIADFQREVAILSSVFHPKICLFLGAYIGTDEVIIVTELLEGNVEQLLRNPNVSLSLYQKLKMNEDAAQGIAWLHGSGIVHRDIKPSNYLYKRIGEFNFQIKVCDFGLADLNSGVLRENNPKGTPLYMAPEVLMSKALNEKVDVYSWAVTMWEILTGQEPYSTVDSVESLVRAVCVDGFRPVIPDKWPQSLKQLVSNCWHSLPESRPAFEEIASKMGDLVLEVAIEDDIPGQLFWKSCFVGRETVPFREFAAQFFDQFPALRGKLPREDETAVMSGYIGEVKKGAFAGGAQVAAQDASERVLHQLRIHLLRLIRLLFVDDASHEEVVNLEYFGKCLQWIGPIEKDPFAFFFRLQKLYSMPWFFGGIRTSDATSLLLTKPPGTFLVRFCNNVQYIGYYVLSVVTVSGAGQVVAHVRIRHKAGLGFSLEKIQAPECATLEELIEGCSAKLNLRKACPGRKYEYCVFEHISYEMKDLQRQWMESMGGSGGGGGGGGDSDKMEMSADGI